MKILKFKTNIQGQYEVTPVAPILNKEEGVSKWNMDTSILNYFRLANDGETTAKANLLPATETTLSGY